MSEEPILLLQGRRIGDLILTFPLMARLNALYPRNPLWLAGEEQFFRELMPLAPKAVFFPLSHLPLLAQGSYEGLVNLGCEHAPAVFNVRSRFRFGYFRQGDGLRLQGFWQLYRASLTRNNRHNAFHWSDLNCMDLPGMPPLGKIMPAGRKDGKKRSRRIGLVVGASEPAKHPDEHFWGQLGRRLAESGYWPYFLGGPADRELAAAAAGIMGRPEANLAGRFSLPELAELMRGLELCISPDTGPMHLADWVGTRVLNLSMGPVHARETGPSSPGQWVLSANMSCVGCWQCSRRMPYCRPAFQPALVAAYAKAIIEGENSPARQAAPDSHDQSQRLILWRTRRDEYGLHDLEPAAGARPPQARVLLEKFWQAAFLSYAAPQGAPDFWRLLQKRARELGAGQPRLAEALRANLGRMLAQCARLLGKGSFLENSFWRSQPGMTRLLAGHTQMFLQNEDYARNARATALERIARTHESLEAG